MTIQVNFMCFQDSNSTRNFHAGGLAVLQSYIFHISMPVCRYYVVIMMKFGL
jgi:hypothetical protein